MHFSREMDLKLLGRLLSANEFVDGLDHVTWRGDGKPLARVFRRLKDFSSAHWVRVTGIGENSVLRITAVEFPEKSPRHLAGFLVLLLQVLQFPDLA